MASTNPKRVSTFIENPAIYIMKNAESMDTGIANTGIMVERQSLRNKNMISTTNPKAMNNVSSTSFIDSLTGFVKSNPTINRYSLGTSILSCSNLL